MDSFLDSVASFLSDPPKPKKPAVPTSTGAVPAPASTATPATAPASVAPIAAKPAPTASAPVATPTTAQAAPPSGLQYTEAAKQLSLSERRDAHLVSAEFQSWAELLFDHTEHLGTEIDLLVTALDVCSAARSGDASVVVCD
jgi:hypothetical protein